MAARRRWWREFTNVSRAAVQLLYVVCHVMSVVCHVTVVPHPDAVVLGHTQPFPSTAVPCPCDRFR